jgi:hypothetical protein
LVITKCPEEHEANVREIYDEQQKQRPPGSEPGRPERVADQSSQNPTTELAKTLATTSLTANTTTGNDDDGGGMSTTAMESARLAGATLPPPEGETTGDVATPESLTVEELEELLKKKRNANAKNQGKDTLGKKNTRTRSTSLRRKTDKPKNDK